MARLSLLLILITQIICSKMFRKLLDYFSIREKNTYKRNSKPPANYSLDTLNGSQLNKVEDFKYLGSSANSQHDIQCREAQAWAAVHVID